VEAVGRPMSMDLSEFLDVFLEECFEGLEVMESGLLNLDAGTDLEEVNTIFRAAHSIKGGSAAFGFNHISEFTHVMETLLDQLRSGKRPVDQGSVDLLLASVDVLREMVEGLKTDEAPDDDRVAGLRKKLEAVIASEPESGETTPEPAGACRDTESPGSEGPVRHWRIRLVPGKEMFREGNDPLALIRELKKLGELTVETRADGLPALAGLDPASCHLSWEARLTTPAGEDEIREIFAWLGEEAVVEIASGEASGHEREAQAGPEEAVTEPAVPASEVESKGAGTSPPVPEPESPPEPGKPATKKANGLKAVKSPANRESGSIRVSIEKVDLLINLVGELVITQSMLNQVGADILQEGAPRAEALLNGLAQLERNTRELQENVLQIRMLPISFAFNRFPRLVRDISNSLGKKVELVLTGEQTEVDKTVLEKIGDPLVHLVRNALDHGLETPEARRAAGKAEQGRLELSAQHESGNIVIRISDDGAGLNREKILRKAIEKGLVSEKDELSDERIDNLIFQPGFSTADKVSDLSGRGVGMDVVKRNINDLGGTVNIHSEPGKGSTVTIRLPLTLAILDGQLARVGGETYILPLISIVESLQIKPGNAKSVTGCGEVYRFRGEYIPIIRLDRLFGVRGATEDLYKGLLVVVETEGRHTGLFVDALLGQQQVVIKSLETNYRQLEGVSGATILGDGQVALILDIPGLVQLFHRQTHRLAELAAVS